MLKFIHAHPIGIILSFVFGMLLAMSVRESVAVTVPVVARPAVVTVPRATVTPPVAKATVQAKPAQSVKPIPESVKLPLTIAVSPHVIKTVCNEKNKLKKDCTRK